MAPILSSNKLTGFRLTVCSVHVVQNVLHFQVDLESVKEEFQKLYGQTLEQFIIDDTSGHYRDLLIAICKGNTQMSWRNCQQNIICTNEEQTCKSLKEKDNQLEIYFTKKIYSNVQIFVTCTYFSKHARLAQCLGCLYPDGGALGSFHGLCPGTGALQEMGFLRTWSHRHHQANGFVLITECLESIKSKYW